jgi:beta-lactamase superfamily II metal-dependent hydrolase
VLCGHSLATTSSSRWIETNDNSVAILLTYGEARILLAGDAEAREEEYMAGGPYTGPLTEVNVSNYKISRAIFALGPSPNRP